MRNWKNKRGRGMSNEGKSVENRKGRDGRWGEEEKKNGKGKD